jgi:hypothetical protein
MSQTAQIYIYIYIYISPNQTPRQYAAIPRLGVKSVSLVNFIVSLVSIAVICLFIPTFVYVMYPLIGSKSLWVTSYNTLMSISCLRAKSVGICLLIIADMPLTIMVAFLCVRQ